MDSLMSVNLNHVVMKVFVNKECTAWKFHQFSLVHLLISYSRKEYIQFIKRENGTPNEEEKYVSCCYII